MEITLKHGEQLLVRCGEDSLSIRCMALGPYDNSDIAFDVVLRATNDRQLVNNHESVLVELGYPLVIRSYLPEDFEPEARGE